MESLFDRFDREWETLGADRRMAVRLPEVLQLAGSAATLEALRRWVVAAPAHDSDRVLLALVSRSVEGHELAARVILQLLLPGVRRLARKWWALGGQREREAAAVAAVYDRIRCYPLARRPGKVAANILLDAGGLLRRQVLDTRLLVPIDDLHDSPAPVPRHPALELADVLRDAVADGVISADEAHIIAASRIAGRRLADMAEERGASLRTLQKHRQAAEAALHAIGEAA
jgi:hypothetical protein